MKKFLLSTIGIFVAICAVNQNGKTNTIITTPNRNIFMDSLPKDGTVVLYKYLPKDHTTTDTMFRNQRLYKNGFNTLRIFR